MVVWITGLSGVGKSTIAGVVIKRLKAAGKPVVWLDGDQVREAVSDEATGHDPRSRLVNALRICRFARLFESQDLLVIVSTMSLFHEVHEWNRQNLRDYLEVWIQAELEALRARDAGGLYSKFASGEERHVGGLDIEPEFPREADLIIENSEHREEFDSIADLILATMGR